MSVIPILLRQHFEWLHHLLRRTRGELEDNLTLLGRTSCSSTRTSIRFGMSSLLKCFWVICCRLNRDRVLYRLLLKVQVFNFPKHGEWNCSQDGAQTQTIKHTFTRTVTKHSRTTTCHHGQIKKQNHYTMDTNTIKKNKWTKKHHETCRCRMSKHL